MECYAFAISIWFMLVRTIRILIIAALYLGRVDTPLFAPGVGIFGPLEVDNWPTVTRKEILTHEAHRHPYIETLGYLYMMQLRYHGDSSFARRANSAWRVIFVQACFPWLHKYRDNVRGPKRTRALTSTMDQNGQLERMLERNGDENNDLRLMAKSMVSSRWLISNDDDDDKVESYGEQSEDEIEAEIARLKKELAAIRKAKQRL